MDKKVKRQPRKPLPVNRLLLWTDNDEHIEVDCKACKKRLRGKELTMDDVALCCEECYDYAGMND